MGRGFEKFLLLLWKNWKLQYRKPTQTILEILVPVLFSIILVVIRSLVDPENKAAVHFQPFCADKLFLPQLCDDIPGPDPGDSQVIFTSPEMLKKFTLLYNPKGNLIVDKAMNYFSEVFAEVTSFDTQKAMEDYYSGNSDNIFAAVQFDTSITDNSAIPDDLKVDIRFPGTLRSDDDKNWMTNVLYPTYQIAGPRDSEKTFGGTPEYYVEGFLSLQSAVTYALMVASGATENQLARPIVKMQRFPHAAWYEDPLLQALQSFVGVIIMISFVYTSINTVKIITTEKEMQLKEAMKIMGLPNWLHWTAWFVKTFALLLIAVVLIVILLKVTWYPNTSYSVFTYADPVVMLLFMILYMCATITFCFAVSVFFSKANTAATIAGLLWFVSYAPYLFMQQQYESLSTATKLGSSILSNTAMAFGFNVMIMFESTQEGVQWSNLWSTSTPDDGLTLGMVMIMLVVDSLIYLAIALYVEAVFPGEYGVPQPWYYPFNKLKKKSSKDDYNRRTLSPQASVSDEFFEREPTGLVSGVRISNLRKVFKKKAAVRNLTLNMYQDQITVLLGHNGAGKTTTMSMLTGMFPPSSGTATVNGYDITQDMAAVRASLGLCPQHNILFDELTVREHLYFFSKLKGLKGDEIEREIQNYIELLELVPKADMKSSTLSGGMKRKLCVGMALCGKSKVVMLDEPTAGMDPSARRALWDLIQKQKESRTILLTTHFMDEADLLGDRIAIMAGGELQCCGSSFFLKKKYGAGYHLIMDKKQECNVSDVTAILKRHISNIEVESNVGSELAYSLPENQSAAFERMLYDLEQNSDRLGVRSYGISLTTLEEVFMKVGADHGQEEAYNIKQTNGKSPVGIMGKAKEILFQKPMKILRKKTYADETYYDNMLSENLNGTESPSTTVTVGRGELHTGMNLVKNQFIAILMKKFLSIIRSWFLMLVQILIPVLFTAIAISVTKVQGDAGDFPRLALTLGDYDHAVTLVQKPVGEGISKTVVDKYISFLEAEKRTVELVDDITETMLGLTTTNPSKVRMSYIAGVTVEPGSSQPNDILIRAWFNNDPYHSPPLALGLALNTMYNLVMSKTISFANLPLPYTTEKQVENLFAANSMGFQLGFQVCFSLAFVSSFYVLFYVKERVCKSKHLQIVSGVKVWIFWLTALLCDFITYLVTAIVLIIAMAILLPDEFGSGADFGGSIFVVLLYFGCSMLPMMYFSAYLFELPSTGYTRMTMVSVFTGSVAFMVVQILGFPGLDLEDVSNGLHWFFLLVPHYSAGAGIRDIFTTFETSNMCKEVVDKCVGVGQLSPDLCWELACHLIPSLKDYCCSRTPNYFKWAAPGIGRNILYSLLVAAFLLVALLLVEYKFITRLRHHFTKGYASKSPEPVLEEDGDVAEEKMRIRNASEPQLIADHTMVLKDVTKYYGKFLAVNGLCLGVKRSECFGLLGVNGAGKTTTFKMMTGDVEMTYGQAWVNGRSIRSEIKEVQKMIGYCPQFDALLDDLTARESLKMFALLRGVHMQDLNHMCSKLAADFDFHRHLDKLVKELSGGNKRKLSTAISLIGDPPVLYLDEPTTGMDPATKRYLWNALCQVRDQGKCIVLTSHSMEECEALCTRLAIMVNGNFMCLGSTQHLKNKFAEGYTLTIKIKKDHNAESHDDHSDAHTAPVIQFVIENFPKAILREKHQELLTFYILDKTLPCSRMFGLLEKGKKEFNIEDYSLGQSSLEQVFLTFTKHQVENV